MEPTEGRRLPHPLSMLGAGLATISGAAVAALFAASLLGVEGGPYIGIVAYVVMPTLLVAGLILIPLGGALRRRRDSRLAAAGEGGAPLPVIDFNRPRTRTLALGFLGITTVNVLLLLAASYKGLEVMDSPQFCGSCHSVMDPEASAHARSPHARVRCAECHIGAGASWFVKSKLSGSWQLVSVAFRLYPRPIPTPVHNLRPARETCEQCHWPAKFVGDRLKVLTRHADDAASTPLKTVMLVHVGGSQGTAARGIHWHVDPGVRIRFLADEKREQVGAVELVAPGREPQTYQAKGPPLANGHWRQMDCVDCHNRPTHIYRSPEDEVDAAIEAGRIDRSLPFARREAVKALRVEYPSAEAARDGLQARLAELYLSDPERARERRAAVDAAAVELAAIWSRNVWPRMKIGWGTYPTALGHEAAPGCFRCHDGDHATADGRAISGDCDLCHRLLSQGEKDPPILRQLLQ
jgi:hypothetical protein